MGLKKQKGLRIETKTLRAKCERVGNFISDTVRVYRESIAFYIQVINQHPEYVDLSKDQMRGAYEALTLGENSQYPFKYSDMPRDLRWDVLSKSVGHYKSWRSNYTRWEKLEETRANKAKKKNKKHQPHKPPVLPKEVHDSPTYYKYSMFKDDTGRDIVLKVRNGHAWVWVKFQYFAYQVDSNWLKGCPSIVFKKDGSLWINWILERYHVATGGVKAQKDKRVCAVDIDLDGDVICSLCVLEPDVNGEVREVARTFVKGHASHVRRRKRDLGKIAKKMRQTVIVQRGFCNQAWGKISSREQSESYRIANSIVEFANLHHCAVIVFEYLATLRPQKGKYSVRSNQKRAYWLQAKISNFTSHIARTKHNILSSRVSPRDTSKFCAYTGEELFRTSDHPRMKFAKASRENWDSVMLKEGYHPGTWAIAKSGYCVHSGLNASRNIALRFYQRYSSQKLILVRG